jgi:transposase
MGAQIQAETPELSMYGFAVFYALCLVLNWWFYLRPNAYVKNPPELRRFAASLKADLSAVRAAFASHWSSGQVEGQINRLEFLKREMYSRAKLDLLRFRVLHPN